VATFYFLYYILRILNRICVCVCVCVSRDTLKRCCLKDIPETLILHLKRFELNLDTLEKQKVNDAFAFPPFLNVYAYTRDGLKKHEGGGGGGEESRDHAAEEALPGEEEEDRNNERKSQSDNDKEETTTPPPPPPPPPRAPLERDDCWYKLRGVLVHSGTANSGHYYSYIQERKRPRARRGQDVLPAAASFLASSSPDVVGVDEGCWMEFNDENVTPIEAKDIPHGTHARSVCMYVCMYVCMHACSWCATGV
jgi:hypothetical protein